MKSEQIGELAKALAAAQAEIKPAAMNASNPYFKSRYADLGSVIEAARPVLPKYGLAVSQLVVGGDQVGVTTILMHSSGQWLESTVTMPLSGDNKNQAQQAGSIISYLRRYSLASILGIYADEDVDANEPHQAQPAQAQRKPAKSQEVVPPEPPMPAPPAPPADKPSDAAWNAWYAICGEADALKLTVPEPPDDVTTAQLRQMYKELDGKIKLLKKAKS